MHTGIHFIDRPCLELAYALTPWDIQHLGFGVAQIHHIKVHDPLGAKHDFAEFQAWLIDHEIKLVTCRLPHTRLRDSFFLQEMGFRFVEMVIQPEKAGLEAFYEKDDCIRLQTGFHEHFLEKALQIAESAFVSERFYHDPCLGPSLSGKRYKGWLENSLNNPAQELKYILHKENLIGFFLTEDKTDQDCYWHLTAISPEYQGCGLGKKAWTAMISDAAKRGMVSIKTTIAVRNTKVLNLYASLGFRFAEPQMTFHWHVSQQD